MFAAFDRARGQHVRWFAHIDWFLLGAALSISLLGLATMRSFSVENAFFEKQLVWILIALILFFIASSLRYDFLRRSSIVTVLYMAIILLLSLVLMFGAVVKGGQNRFNLGFFAIQPADPAKLILVMVLAKYFARRHVEIAHIRHILISGAYAFLLFACVFFQPDLGSGIVIAFMWLGLVLVAGISWKHLVALLLTALIIFGALWHWGLHPYQKQRILTFIHPLADIHGSGYNAYQAMVAVGSGQVVGKGVGFGTQSKLRFLPEYQTDFIFASFAEEWGYFGVMALLGLFSIVILRTLRIASHGADNFDMLFTAGVAIYITSQFIVHAGMNLGLFPITGSTLPFMSYGGSHLITEYLALGIVMGLRRRSRPNMRARDETELLGMV